MTRTRIVLVRHGQTVWNREQRFRGQVDVELDELGLKQAEATGECVAARWPVVAVYASPLRRTAQTAQPIADAQGLAVELLDGLLDISFGEWQGELAQEVANRFPDLFRAWQKLPHTVHFPKGESLEVVRNRVVSALEGVVARHAGQSVALVSHAVVNRVLLCTVLGWGNAHFWRIHQGTCCINVFDVEEDGSFTIVQLNSTHHLHHIALD